MNELNLRLGKNPLFLSAKEGYRIPFAIVIFFALWLAGLMAGRFLATGLIHILGFTLGNNDSLRIALRKLIVCGTQITTFFLWVKLYEKRKIQSIGFVSKKPWNDYLKGAYIGACAIFVITIFLVALGAVHFELSKINDGNMIASICIIAFSWMIQSASEEIAIRGWLIPTIGKCSNPIVAIVITALIFGIFHLFSAGVTVLSFINLTLSGLFFAIYAINNENIIGICGLHFMWNFTLGNILGLPVSGFTDNGQTIFAVNNMEDNLLTGGAFGPEGGIIATFVLLLSTSILYLQWKKKPLKSD